MVFSFLTRTRSRTLSSALRNTSNELFIWTSKFKSLATHNVVSLVAMVVDMPFEPFSIDDVERIWVNGQSLITQRLQPFNSSFFDTSP